MWDLNNMSVGDYIEVQVVNKRGDRNLDEVIIRGCIKDIVPDHKMVRLESGWCCHAKDVLRRHIPVNQVWDHRPAPNTEPQESPETKESSERVKEAFDLL